MCLFNWIFVKSRDHCTIFWDIIPSSVQIFGHSICSLANFRDHTSVIKRDLNRLIQNSSILFAKIKDLFSPNELLILIKLSLAFFFLRKKVPKKCNVPKLGRTDIQSIAWARYLGFLPDHHLNWISHINFLVAT